MDAEAFGRRRPWEGGGGRPSRGSLSPGAGGLLRHPVRSGGPDPLGRLDLAQASQRSAERLGLRAQEKEQLAQLNDRFAGYATRVRGLEWRHRALSREVEALRRPARDPAQRLARLYQQEARGLRARLETEARDKARLEDERQRLLQARGQLRERCAQEARRRLEAEQRRRHLRQEAAQAALAARHADGTASTLRAQLAFLQKLLREERAELAAAAATGAEHQPEAGAAGGGRSGGTPKPDLSAALREIRAQYENLAAQNRQAAEEWYCAKFASAVELAGRHQEEVRSIRLETAEYRQLLQSRSAEIEALRGAVDVLHQQLESLEGQWSTIVSRGQGRVAELEQEISEAKEEMARHIGEYQELLNIKMALDVEITAYRTLLEGEEEAWWSSAWPGRSPLPLK